MGSRHAQGHQHQGDAVEHVLTCVLVILPLVLGLLVTPRALGAGALGGESVARLLLAYAPGPPRAEGGAPPAASRPIADTADLLSYLQQVGLSGAGQRVRATGLALRAEVLGSGEFALLRYAIAHCVADARPLALLVATPGDRALVADQWVEVEGVLAITERDGDRLVTIAAERDHADPGAARTPICPRRPLSATRTCRLLERSCSASCGGSLASVACHRRQHHPDAR